MRVVGKDAFERCFRVIGNDDVEHSAGASNRRIVTALDEAFAVGLKQCSVETQETDTEPTSSFRSLWALVAEPDWERILRRWGSDDAVVEKVANLGDRCVGESVALCDVCGVELELRTCDVLAAAAAAKVRGWGR